MKINVFPNTGHHYFFVPLEEKLLDEHKNLKAAARAEGMPWLNLRRSSDGSVLPWAIGRLGLDKNTKAGQQRIGLWVCIESNLGDAHRGLILNERESVPADVASAAVRRQFNYAFDQIEDEDEGATKIELTLHLGESEIDIEPIEVIWVKPSGKPIEVDLIVDYGNTRTVALAIENRAGYRGVLAPVCQNLRFLPKGMPFEQCPTERHEDTVAIVDSWFVLKEPCLSQLEPDHPLRTSSAKKLNLTDDQVREVASFRPLIKLEEEQTESAHQEHEPAPPRKWWPSRKKNDKPPPDPPHFVSEHYLTEWIPTAFVEYSPVVMGEEARRELSALPVNLGGSFTMSSPKRYIWDQDKTGSQGIEYWNMIPNPWTPTDSSMLPLLRGEFLKFMYKDGRDWDSPNPPPFEPRIPTRPTARSEAPAYPRRDAMCWAALELLEMAHRQINSYEWRKNNKPFLPRHIKTVTITFPSGWIGPEREAYERLWQRALNVFSYAHLSVPGVNCEEHQRHELTVTPKLRMDLDEAVASQLPFVYSEIYRFGNEAENWMRLYGRPDPERPGKSAIRVMTVDIGGGTSDFSVVEYRDKLDGVGVRLDYRVLFRDSSTCAGDKVVKELIERVLLPSVARSRFAKLQTDQDGGEPDAFVENFEEVFGRAFDNAGLQETWSRISKLVLVPIVRRWLMDLWRETWGDPKEKVAGWMPKRIVGLEGKLVDSERLRELNEFIQERTTEKNMIPEDAPIRASKERVIDCIKKVLAPPLRNLGKYVAAFDIDVVVLSGKISEVPQVKELLDECLPISPRRIVPMNCYLAGDWYPLNRNKRIADAKSVTAVGAALRSAIESKLIRDWRIQGHSELGLARNYWGVMHSVPNKVGFGDLILSPDDPDETIVKKTMFVNGAIGRTRYSPKTSTPEQQYILRYAKGENQQENELEVRHGDILEVSFQRLNGDEDGLQIVSARDLDGNELSVESELELRLCTLEDGEFWLDKGRFKIEWD